jgi:hypothetical protein
MTKGERATLLVKPGYAYGENGKRLHNGVFIPPNSTLKYDVSCDEKGKRGVNPAPLSTGWTKGGGEGENWLDKSLNPMPNHRLDKRHTIMMSKMTSHSHRSTRGGRESKSESESERQRAGTTSSLVRVAPFPRAQP